jgi:hypothetical protein
MAANHFMTGAVKNALGGSIERFGGRIEPSIFERAD